MTDNSGEVKPCPFCGKSPAFDALVYCENDVCANYSKDFHEEIWNSAWAHKRIEELEAEVKRLQATAYYAGKLDGAVETELLCRRMGEFIQACSNGCVGAPITTNFEKQVSDLLSDLRQWEEQKVGQ